ncbi:Eukaryotic translation initiation factor NCBP [Dendrobium catenatum]|uniref:Eukaryotic translation initiation factor NCBP n=2 Tax=Dendrobium catenatum TaxID=906689 RepID=A0A2I0WFA5_9ASPA|nr:Eukaryotic translation initiation factor NCBP [Dendrobium catenatum]
MKSKLGGESSPPPLRSYSAKKASNFPTLKFSPPSGTKPYLASIIAQSEAYQRRMDTAEKKEIEAKAPSVPSTTPPPPQPAASPAPPASGGEVDADGEAEERERQARELKSGLHPLKHKFVFWYTRRTPGVRSQTSYEENIKKIIEFSTVEGFWVCYCHLARPSTLPSPTDLHLFKEGIRPLWEDSANCNGGKWIIRFKKVVSGRFWEDLVLALIGDQLDYGENICGAVLSIRFNEDILSVWNRNASDHQAVMALRDSIKRHLKLPPSYVMEYKPHDASLRDNSSYRNTWLRG